MTGQVGRALVPNPKQLTQTELVHKMRVETGRTRAVAPLFDTVNRKSGPCRLGQRRGGRILEPPGQMAAHECAVIAAFDFHPAVMQFDETIDQREAQSRSCALAGAALGRKPLEHAPRN